MTRPEKRERIGTQSKLISAVNYGKVYKDYSSAHWMTVRVTVFNRDNYTCKHCKSKENLRCHHIMYTSGYPSWDYDLCIYETLCETCHDKFHETIKGSELVVTERKYLQYVSLNKQGKADFSKLSKIKMIPKKKFKNTVNKKPKKKTLKQKFQEADKRVQVQINFRGK